MELSIATVELPYGSETLLWYHNIKDCTKHLIKELPHKWVSIKCAGQGVEESAT